MKAVYTLEAIYKAKTARRAAARPTAPLALLALAAPV